MSALDIDRCLDRLDDALRRVGARGLVPGCESEAVDAIAAAIAPWTLPADVERLWRRVSVGELVVVPWRMPRLVEPAWALDAYRQAFDVGYPLVYGPPLLFPFAVAGETRWSVELRSGPEPAGTLYSHGDAIEVEYPSVADLVDTVAELVEHGDFEHGPEGHLLLADPPERRARDERLQRAGGPADVSNDPAGWPDHWLRSAGIDLRDREPLGASHTIAELLSAAADEPTDGRIAGVVAGLTHLGAGALVLVDDDTATVEVWCPADVSPWGPINGRRFEFAVRLEEPPAHATAVRPIDP